MRPAAAAPNADRRRHVPPALGESLADHAADTRLELEASDERGERTAPEACRHSASANTTGATAARRSTAGRCVVKIEGVALRAALTPAAHSCAGRVR